MSDSCENHVFHLGYIWPNFPNLRSKSHNFDFFGTYCENIDFRYRLLISFLRVIRPSDCDLEYHFGPKVLKYGRKKLYLLRFLQLVFVMTSPLYIFLFRYNGFASGFAKSVKDFKYPSYDRFMSMFYH
jgi:hypothetical protein